MFTSFIIIGFAILLHILAGIRDVRSHSVDDGLVGFLVIVGSISLFICSWAVPLFMGMADTNYESYSTEQTTNIVSLRSDTLVNGQLMGVVFIISGQINETPVYYYYQNTSDGGFIQSHINANGVVLYEDAPNDVGYIRIITTYDRQSEIQPYKHWIYYNDTSKLPKSTTTQIHIPKGTIVRQFKVQ